MVLAEEKSIAPKTPQRLEREFKRWLQEVGMKKYEGSTGHICHERLRHLCLARRVKKTRGFVEGKAPPLPPVTEA